MSRSKKQGLARGPWLGQHIRIRGFKKLLIFGDNLQKFWCNGCEAPQTMGFLRHSQETLIFGT